MKKYWKEVMFLAGTLASILVFAHMSQQITKLESHLLVLQGQIAAASVMSIDGLRDTVRANARIMNQNVDIMNKNIASLSKIDSVFNSVLSNLIAEVYQGERY